MVCSSSAFGFNLGLVNPRAQRLRAPPQPARDRLDRLVLTGVVLGMLGDQTDRLRPGSPCRTSTAWLKPSQSRRCASNPGWFKPTAASHHRFWVSPPGARRDHGNRRKAGAHMIPRILWFVRRLTSASTPRGCSGGWTTPLCRTTPTVRLRMYPLLPVPVGLYRTITSEEIAAVAAMLTPEEIEPPRRYAAASVSAAHAHPDSSRPQAAHPNRGSRNDRRNRRARPPPP